jgi:hypothetical protein
MQKPRRTGTEKLPQALVGELIPFAPPPVPKVRRFRLTSARGIRRELAAIYTELRNGELDNETARTAAFILRCTLESIRTDEIESRLTALENLPMDSEP